jgi:hypothetical protein
LYCSDVKRKEEEEEEEEEDPILLQVNDCTTCPYCRIKLETTQSF